MPISGRETLEQAPAPPAPRNPYPLRGDSCSSRQGAPPGRGALRSPDSLSFPTLLHPKGESLAPPLKRSVTSNKTLAPRLGGTGWPHVYTPTSKEKPLPMCAHRLAHPCSPGCSLPAARLPSSPGTQTAVPTCGRGQRGQARPAAPPIPGHLGGHSPPTRSATGRSCRPASDTPRKKNRAGCPPGHPRPPISGGDPGRGATVGREQRAQGPTKPLRAAPLLPRLGAALAPPGGRGGLPRLAVTHSTPGQSTSGSLSVQRGDSHPCSPHPTWGGGGVWQKVLLLPRGPQSPLVSLTLFPLLDSLRPGYRSPHAPALHQPRILHRRERERERERNRLYSAPGARPGPEIFKSNQSPLFKKVTISLPARPTLGEAQGTGCPARDASPARFSAPVRRRRLPNLISPPPSFQELSLLTCQVSTRSR
ncbi:protein SPT2 homolog [Phyllostomus hastatus]|uniref:protein SPT2 homolog n=1 Tax=Phyllostomus hastatus TaxID=9423 RepID=UPI001E680903|nr:protein SPT2 homolog [Phyllostomus hastatus]